MLTPFPLERAAQGRQAGPYFGEYPPDFFDFIVIDECHRGSSSDLCAGAEVVEPLVFLGMSELMAVVLDKTTVLALFCSFRQAERSVHYALSSPNQWTGFLAYYYPAWSLLCRTALLRGCEELGEPGASATGDPSTTPVADAPGSPQSGNFHNL